MMVFGGKSSYDSPGLVPTTGLDIQIHHWKAEAIENLPSLFTRGASGEGRQCQGRLQPTKRNLDIDATGAGTIQYAVVVKKLQLPGGTA